MPRNFFKVLALPLAALFIAGCATTRARHAETKEAAADTQTQTQVQALQQENQELHSQMESRDRAISNNFSRGSSSDSSGIVRVPGVSGMQLQKALRRAGYDPGPIDGRPGRKTRAAVKAFQKKHHLTADGVVGERTWAALQSE